MQKVEFTVSPEEAGNRLDAFLARHMPESSRTFLQKLVREGGVLIDGEKAPAPRTLLKAGRRDAAVKLLNECYSRQYARAEALLTSLLAEAEAAQTRKTAAAK